MPSLHFATSVDGRSRAQRRRAASHGRDRLDLRAARSASRSCTSASTTSSTSPPASRWPRACAAGAPAPRRLLRRGRRRGAARSRRGRAHDGGAGRARPSNAGGRQPPRRGDAAGRHHARARADLRPLRRLGRSRSCTSCCRSSRAWATPGTGSGEGDPTWLLIALGLRVPVLRGLRRPVPHASSCATGRGSTSRASYQITMAGLAATRLFAAAGAGRDRAHRVGAAALGDGAPRGRRPDARLPRPALRASTWARSSIGGLGLYLGILNGPGAVRDHRRAGDLRRCVAFLIAGAMALPARRRRALDRRPRARARAAPGALLAERRDRARLGRRRASARRSASCARARWGVLGAVAWWGFDIAVAVGVLPRLRRRPAADRR